MDLIRLIILIFLLGGLTLFLVQNFSPALPLVFFGMRTQPLPLALWILSSLLAGASTSILINSLSKLVTNPIRIPQTDSSQPQTRTFTREQTTPRPQNPPSSTSQSKYNQVDDWERNTNEDDWDVGENLQEKSPPASSSSYSFSYQDPKNTAVGKTESVYDADYRVIVPPYKQPNTEATDDADDWDFFAEDEDFPDNRSNVKR
jgi:hypothetical protein